MSVCGQQNSFVKHVITSACSSGNQMEFIIVHFSIQNANIWNTLRLMKMVQKVWIHNKELFFIQFWKRQDNTLV